MSELAPAGAIIETYRGDFHVRDDVKTARAALRGAGATGAGTVFKTRAGQLVTITYAETIRIRGPRQPSRRRRRARGYALLAAGLLLEIVGVLGICLGGSALIATVFGHASEITVPWFLAIPGFVAYYAGGWIGHEGCDGLGIQ